MKARTLMRNASVTLAAILFATVANVRDGRAGTPAPAGEAADACAAPEYHQFDFWIGDWDAFDLDKPDVTVARNRVHIILGGCVLLEDYLGADGHEGQSFSIYDASRKVWHQSWVTNRGQLLVIEGKMEGDEMVLSGADKDANGHDRLVRGIWKPVPGGVRETAVRSSDGGKTWQPWFDMMFRPHAADASDSPGDDAKIVAALDSEYQAAVKRNDSAAMDRILADDFVLVTGSGKTNTKQDLLSDARSGKDTYEHNEELEKKVRVYGDTAIVTAKLWEKGKSGDREFDHTIWFSDTYVRRPGGWKYVFGQSSYPPPNTP